MEPQREVRLGLLRFSSRRAIKAVSIDGEGRVGYCFRLSTQNDHWPDKSTGSHPTRHLSPPKVVDNATSELLVLIDLLKALFILKYSLVRLNFE